MTVSQGWWEMTGNTVGKYLFNAGFACLFLNYVHVGVSLCGYVHVTSVPLEVKKGCQILLDCEPH